jgi:acyl-CoA oxidase
LVIWLTSQLDSYEGDNFVLDLQVVRAAAKAYKRYTSAAKPDPSILSPMTNYLRLLSQLPLADNTFGGWADPHTSVYLLEQRAIHMVREYAQHQDDPDASAPQRVARAVTEAFVVAQVEGIIHELPSQLPGKDAHVFKDLLTLVSGQFHHSKSMY